MNSKNHYCSSIQRITREKNGQVNAPTKLDSVKEVVNNRTIIQETLQIPYINKIMNIEEKQSWMTPIITFLKWEKLVDDKKEVRKVDRRLAYFSMESE